MALLISALEANVSAKPRILLIDTYRNRFQMTLRKRAGFFNQLIRHNRILHDPDKENGKNGDCSTENNHPELQAFPMERFSQTVASPFSAIPIRTQGFSACAGTESGCMYASERFV